VAADLSRYREVWLVDFEYAAPPGDRPIPICLVARELRTGQTLRLWQDDLRARDAAPYPTSSDALFVSFFASAELGCHRALGWPMPVRILDLYVEFRNRANGLSVPHGFGLLGALTWYGLDAMDAVEKDAMRTLALRGGPWAEAERAALLDYCGRDVEALARLLPAMLPDIDLPRALLRGRYMAAVARMEHTGVPIDVEILCRLRAEWEAIQDRLIRGVGSQFGVFDGRTFKADRWQDWVARRGLAWPRLSSGKLALDDNTFREMARLDADVALMRNLRDALAQLRLADLTVGSDGRNRTLLSPFRSRTGRNQPSNSQCVFGLSVWMRGLIRPASDRAVAYVDWEQQEFGIGAALSGDSAMQRAYISGDPYLEFGKQAGRLPHGATKETHRAEREQFKVAVLATQYGMGPEGLARRLGGPTAHGRELLALHRRTYPRFWEWSDGVEHHAMLLGSLHTIFGWTMRVGLDANPRSLRNFPCQANGAEMLRLACSLATERGVSIVAPVHDAVLVEGPAAEIETVVAEMKQAMAEASEVVLSGFRLRTEAKVFRSPDRYMDPRGRAFWDRVMDLLSVSS
jgi:DNA polymerase I